MKGPYGSGYMNFWDGIVLCSDKLELSAGVDLIIPCLFDRMEFS